jgi:hypothetical protein
MPQRRHFSQSLRPGDVIRAWDRKTIPEKHKRHLCVCLEQQLFLRINSRLVFLPAFQLLEMECDFIQHDSWLELTQMTRLHGPDIRDSELLGRLSANVTAQLLVAVEAARTLTRDQKTLIRERLTGPEGPLASLP